MKNFLVCLVCATMLCSCGSDKEVFESWKGWVAMNTCSYSLKDEFKKEYANKGDLSSLFYENETTVRWGRDRWETDDLSDMGLRYDLTLPLSRFFACHKNDLSL